MWNSRASRVILICKDLGDPGSLHLPASLSLEKSPGPHGPRWCLELQPSHLHPRQQDGRTKRKEANIWSPKHVLQECSVSRTMKGLRFYSTWKLVCQPATVLQRLAENARTTDFITHSTASSKSVSIFASVPLVPKSQEATWMGPDGCCTCSEVCYRGGTLRLGNLELL